MNKLIIKLVKIINSQEWKELKQFARKVKRRG